MFALLRDNLTPELTTNYPDQPNIPRSNPNLPLGKLNLPPSNPTIPLSNLQV